MSDDKAIENDPERTLVTLDQLSQTIEVMTNVVNRLRRHLSEQIKNQMKEEQQTAELLAADIEENLSPPDSRNTEPRDSKRESFVVEISQQEAEPAQKPTKILH